MKTEVTELLGIEYPIIQGGMAWVAEYHLAAAVSAAGGLGLIGAASAPADWVRQQVREVKKLTDKQKSRLWEQRRNANFQASRRLEGVDILRVTLSAEDALARLEELRRHYER